MTQTVVKVTAFSAFYTEGKHNLDVKEGVVSPYNFHSSELLALSRAFGNVPTGPKNPVQICIFSQKTLVLRQTTTKCTFIV